MNQLPNTLRNIPKWCALLMIVIFSQVAARAAGGSYTIYFENTAGWDNVYVFTWDDKNCGEYPGAQFVSNKTEPIAQVKKNGSDEVIGTCTKETIDGKSYFKMTFPSNCANSFIINAGRDSANKDLPKAGNCDITLSDGGKYNADGVVSPGNNDNNDNNPGSGYWIYVADEGNWATRGGTLQEAALYVHFKISDSDKNVWPGDKLTYYPNLEYKGHKGLYAIEVPENYKNANLWLNSNNKEWQYPRDGNGTYRINSSSLFIITSSTLDGNNYHLIGNNDTPERLSAPLTEPIASTSGTLPILHINVYEADQPDVFNSDMLNKDYVEKDEHTCAEYYIEVPDDVAAKYSWAKPVGSADAPLPLSIKLRGNFTRTGYSKKPYKLKLGSKAGLLGLSKSKHFALLAHADDDKAFMRNYVCFELGKMIGLPWTPSQQPVEVVINGEYRGLYFLTESIRIEPDRINITEGAEEEMNPVNISGGYLVELDNYDEDSSIQYSTEEKSCSGKHKDLLRVTFDTPEILSDLQRTFIKDQFDTMNDLVGKCNTSEGDDLWKYMDLDDAVRYYIVMEIMGHWEAYHGSTYLFRDYGADQKWHFSPLWDCGHAFEPETRNCQIWDRPGSYGCTWISSMYLNSKFKSKLTDTWKWFMAEHYPALASKIEDYAKTIDAAAKYDAAFWHGRPTPTGHNNPVKENTAIYWDGNGNVVTDKRLGSASYVTDYLSTKISYLQGIWGTYSSPVAEPARDTTPAADLPRYADPDWKPKKVYVYDDANWVTNDHPAMYAYIYKDNVNNNVWPGLPMIFEKNVVVTAGTSDTRYSGVYTIDIPLNLEEGKLIINTDGGGRYPADNAPGMDINGKDVFFRTTTNSLSAIDASQVGYSWSQTLPVLFVDVPDVEEISRDKVKGTWSMLDKEQNPVTPNKNNKISIKGRGSETWENFAKKPYKIEFDKKQTICGLVESKHFVLLPYLAGNEENPHSVIMHNLAGYEISRRIGLTWTPEQTPIELVINGNYKGLYYLCENVRPSVRRVPVGDYADWNDPTADILYDLNNHWLIEIDNTETDPSLVNYTWSADLPDGGSKSYKVVSSNPDFTDKDVAANEHGEILSDALTSHLDAVIKIVNAAGVIPEDMDFNGTKEWYKVIDPAEATRYYIVQELMDDNRAFNTSFFLWHTPADGASNGMWMFGPAWDFSGSFYNEGGKQELLHDKNSGSAFVSTLSNNVWWTDRVAYEYFLFTGNEEGLAKFDGTDWSPNHDGWASMPRMERARAYAESATAGIEGLDSYLADRAAEIETALKYDSAQWPQYKAANDAIASQVANIPGIIANNAGVLEQEFADTGITTALSNIEKDGALTEDMMLFDITGRRVSYTQRGGIYILRTPTRTYKVIAR